MNVTGRKKRVLQRMIHYHLVEYIRENPESALELAVLYGDYYAATMTYVQLQDWERTLRISARLLRQTIADAEEGA